jgi:uncharacterized protein YndB with AHSA1/START domain
MVSDVEKRGFVLIADITGYSAYLGDSELEHAQQTLTDLLEVLLDQAQYPFVFSQLEGDAVMSYALASDVEDPQQFLERMEETYVEFRRAIDLMVLNNTCQCAACANVGSLDLKFFVHFGSFVIQPVSELNQLVGSDVNLIHRLLKNTVTAETGIRAYLLLTEPAVNALALDPVHEEMVSHPEETTDFDVIKVWVRDMHPVYENANSERRSFYEPDQLLLSIDTVIPVPIEEVWRYSNQSEFRNTIIGSDSYDVVDRRGVRVGEGSTYQCYHGNMTVKQLVLDWRPFQRVILEQLVPLPGKPTTSIIEFTFEETANGTRFTETVAKPTGPPVQRLLATAMMTARRKRSQTDLEAFRDQVTADYLASHQIDGEPVQIDQALIRSAAANSLKKQTNKDH